LRRPIVGLKEPDALDALRAEIDHTVLAPVYEAIARVQQDLPPAVTFLGFCGAPWTLATSRHPLLAASCMIAAILP
jgi:uroporphyrinogen-III decarboxylase